MHGGRWRGVFEHCVFFPTPTCSKRGGFLALPLLRCDPGDEAHAQQRVRGCVVVVVVAAGESTWQRWATVGNGGQQRGPTASNGEGKKLKREKKMESGGEERKEEQEQRKRKKKERKKKEKKRGREILRLGEKYMRVFGICGSGDGGQIGAWLSTRWQTAVLCNYRMGWQGDWPWKVAWVAGKVQSFEAAWYSGKLHATHDLRAEPMAADRVGDGGPSMQCVRWEGGGMLGGGVWRVQGRKGRN